MKTTVFSTSDLEKKEVQKKIKYNLENDELVVFPTETVYGIGANALSETAVKKIFSVKGRPSDNPLIVHLSKAKDVYKYVNNVSKHAEILMNAFWPGPLTLVFESKGIFSPVVTGGLKTVAIRVPSHKTAKKVIELSGVPICAPSANISGRPSSTLFSHVLEDFDGKVSIIIDGGPTDIGLESTVLDLTVDIPTILRPGKITKDMIEKVLNTSIINHTEVQNDLAPKSPGMKYKHYAPKGNVTLIDGSFEETIEYIQKQLFDKRQNKCAVLCPDEFADMLNGDTIIKLGSLDNLESIATNLFKSLRLMDEMNIDYIYIPAVSYEGLGQAIMNRLLKAANQNLIKL